MRGRLGLVCGAIAHRLVAHVCAPCSDHRRVQHGELSAFGSAVALGQAGARGRNAKKLTKQKNFRLADDEDKAVPQAAHAAGLTESQWLRLMTRVALGETALLEQLQRASRLQSRQPSPRPVQKRARSK
jgi:hypothetical protein